MKKTAVVVVIALVSFLTFSEANAQKIGYVDMQDIISNMPEARKADTSLNQYQTDLYKEFQNMQQEFQDNATKFIKDSATMSDAVKEVKRDELQGQQQRIGAFQQGIQNRINEKQMNLFKPILQKANDAVSAVAKQKGYTWVFSSSNDENGASMDVLIVKPKGDDLTAAVKTNLGIK